VLLIRCPWCGPRDEVEFRYGGQAGVAYPGDPDALTDEEWAGYLFMRENPKGDWTERWFQAVRSTATNEFRGTAGGASRGGPQP
jgi:heterotetrameric sarcosine oxidase delta subunit